MSADKNEQSYDHSSHKEFFDYYAEQSVTPETMQRLNGIRDAVQAFIKESKSIHKFETVADIGCGAGSLAILWAEQGLSVKGLDVNEPLIDLARKRTKDTDLSVEFFVGSATQLPWADESVDICLVPELLEHVPEWELCLDEFMRILKPGGILYLTTSNKLCPKQSEFTLPAYSWYPQFLKRRYEKLAVTTRPEIAGYATYPAVNWFSYYSLKKLLNKRNFSTFDRFDIMYSMKSSNSIKSAINLFRMIPPLRFIGHVLTPYTVLIATKEK